VGDYVLKPKRKVNPGKKFTTVSMPSELRKRLYDFTEEHPEHPSLGSCVAVAVEEWMEREKEKLSWGGEDGR